jgi:hypothetical protein
MFDPNSITPSEELLDDWRRAGPDSSIHNFGLFKDYIIAARWGAAQAVEALRHQWPLPITDRRPTAEDGDKTGWVQVWDEHGHIDLVDYRHTNGLPWLHTPRWRPKPEPTPKQRARELLRLAANEELVAGGFSPDAIALLRQVVESAPEATP